MRNSTITIILAAMFMSLTACVTVSDKKVDVKRAASNHVAAGLEYMRQNQPANARRHLTKAVEIDDDSAEAHNALALLYRYERDDKREEEQYKKALKADPNYSAARNNYGTYLARKKDFDGAIKQFSLAAESATNDNRSLAYENKGRVLVAMDKKDEAKEAFNKALRLNPRSSSPALELADLYYDQGDLKSADFYYSNYAQAVNPQPARALWLGIRITTELKQVDRSSSYELALKNLYPKSAEYQAWKKWRGSSS